MANKQPKPTRDRLVRSRHGSAMAQTQIWLTPELRAAVALVQAKESATMGEVVRSATIWFLRKHYQWALDQSKVPEDVAVKV